MFSVSDFLIRLSSMDEIHHFIRLATLCPCDVQLASGTQTTNAKTFMGVFNLDFANPLRVTVSGPREHCDSFCQSVEPYRIEA